MKNNIVLLLLSFAFIFKVSAQCPATLTASVVVVSASCPSNGKATINTNAPAVQPLTYTLLTGPVGATLNVPQNSKIFNSLLAGSYTVKAACSNGANTTIPFTITDTYTAISNINTTVATSCSSFAPSGVVTITAVTGGTAPLLYSIYKTTDANYADALSVYNSSTTKNVTSYGTYQIRVKDACNQFYTKSIDVQPTVPPVKIEMWYAANNQPCANPANMEVYFSYVNAITGDYYSGSDYFSNGGIKVKVYEKSASSCAPTGPVLFDQIVTSYTLVMPLVASKMYYIQTITSCGDTTNYCQDLTDHTLPDASVITFASGCASGLPTPIKQSIVSEYLQFLNYPVTAVVKNSGGTTVYTQTINDESQFLSVDNLPLGNYSIKFTDKCGVVVNTNVTNPAASGPANALLSYEGIGSCDFGASNQNQVGTKMIAIYVKGYVQGLKEATVKILSGPSNVGINGVNNPIGTNQYVWQNMLPGNYVVRVVSPCLNYDLPLTVSNLYLQQETFTITAATSCGGTGSISLSASYQGPYNVSYGLTNAANGVELQTNLLGGFVNLPAGNYYVKVKKQNYCDGNFTYTNTNTVTILAPGAAPAITKKIGVVCEDAGGMPLSTGNAYLEIAGAAPLILEYKLASSSTWINYSNNAAAAISISGLTASAIYDIRVTSCGKTTATQVTIEPIQALYTTGSLSPCNNNPFKLSAPLIPGAAYEWRNAANAVVSSTNEYNIADYNPSYDGTYVCKVSFGVCVTRNIVASISSTTCNVVLPISVESFSAIKQQCDVSLNWKVANALNFNNFIVEKSIDGNTYAAINTVAFYNNKTEYNFIDNSTTVGNNYYRLKLIDKNGNFKYSEIRKIIVNCTSNVDVKIYPTLANTFVNINLPNMQDSYLISITDITGKLVFSTTLQKYNSQQQIDVSKFTSGTYVLQLRSSKLQITKKMVIQH